MKTETLDRIQEEITKRTLLQRMLEDIEGGTPCMLGPNDFAPSYTTYLDHSIKCYTEGIRLLGMETPEDTAQAELILGAIAWANTAFYILIKGQALTFGKATTDDTERVDS
jgi:hypothetical protein